MSTYLLVDGNYLEKAHASLITAFFGADIVPALDYRQIANLAPRSYYYAAIDDAQRQNETADQHKARVDAEVARLDDINALPGCHVRMGSVTGKAIRRRRQKQVDVQLAVDALLHAFNKNMDLVTLIAGDLDFKPLVDALITLGVRTIVTYEKNSAARDLYRSADHADEITLQRAYEWSTQAFRDANPFPSATQNSPAPHGQVLQTGQWKGRTVNLYLDHNNVYHLFAPEVPRVYSQDCWFPNREMLERYFTTMYGPIEWPTA